MAPRKTPPASPKRPARTAKPAAPAATKAKPAPRKRSSSRSTKPKAAPDHVELSNVDRVRADLKDFGPDLERSGLAGAALTLARDLDNRKNSATSHAMCAKALVDVMGQLRELAPPRDARDGIDRIRGKDDRRRGRMYRVK